MFFGPPFLVDFDQPRSTKTSNYLSAVVIVDDLQSRHFEKRGNHNQFEPLSLFSLRNLEQIS